MNQETYNGIMNVLQRGSGVMAQEYCQAFSAVVAELQKRIKAEQDAEAEKVKVKCADAAEAAPTKTKKE